MPFAFRKKKFFPSVKDDVKSSVNDIHDRKETHDDALQEISPIKKISAITIPAKFRHRTRRGRRDDELDDFEELYVGEDGAHIDMTKMERHHTRTRWVIFCIIIFACIAIGMYAGWRVFGLDVKRDDQGVTVTVNVDDKVASGDIVQVEIVYENRKNVTLKEGGIELVYPDGFHFQDSDPVSLDDRHHTWDTGEVVPGSRGHIRIRGQLVGEKNETKDFSVVFTYRPKNFNYDFQETTKATTTISASTLSLKADLPDQTQSGASLLMHLEFTNTAKVAARDLQLLAEYPHDCSFTSADPSPLGGTKNTWRFSELASEATQKIDIRGSCDGHSADTKEFRFQLGFMEMDNTFDVQIDKNVLVIIVNPELEMSFDVPELADVNGTIAYTLTIKNTSDAEIKKLHVRVIGSGSAIDKNITNEHTIDKLSAFDVATVNGNVQTEANDHEQQQSLKLHASVDSASVAGNEVSFSNTADASIKIRGALALQTEARYFDKNLKKIGNGPLPPTVNQETTYVVEWTITNGANEMKDVVVSTLLPDDVLWKDSDDDDLIFTASSHTLEFRRRTLPPFATEIRSFRVVVLPTQDDINSLKIITGDTTMNATDVFTQEKISSENNRLTTDLPNDEGAAGKGVVVGDAQ